MRFILVFVILAGCAQDKMQHLVMGAGVSVAARAIGATPVEACLASLGVGVVKEIYDINHGTVEAADIGATVLGCSVSLAF